MKELSIEQKAQRYDEAFKEVSVAHKDEDRHLKATLERIFPALEESEDERIRKALIKFFTLSDDNADYQCCGVHYKDILAWLEKQGERKPVNVIEFEKELYNRFGQVRDFTLGMRIAKYFYEMGVKAQVKQEGTNRNVDSQKTKSEFKKLYNDIDECINSLVWARKLHDDTAETRAHEQMERLMVATQQNISLMLDNGYAERERRKSEQEWGEEDETNASYICAALDCYYRLRKERNNTNGQENLDKARNWLYNKLKSLKPQNRWKPSEEQIKALEHFVRSVGESGYASPYDNNTKLLYSLLEQFKKLTK